MPAIRDYSSAYESVTSDAGITIPMCAYAAGDLLLVFAMVDTVTTAPTWSCTGYTQLFALNNTVGSVCYWKIATASEADVVVGGGTDNETYNGCVISIQDVDQAFPFGNAAVFSSTTAAASTRFLMSTITTTRNNALVIYQATGSATASGVHFVENSAHELLISDGTAEGMGVGWGYQKTAGVTPSNIYACIPTTGAGTKATIQIWPPSTGATVFPPYAVSDASILLDPNAAAANFDSNTFMANTADTGFGTSIASKTCNDATVAAAADIGINSFHSFLGLTNATTANQMSGARQIMAAARYNVGTRNILAHFRHPTPANNQRLTPLSSGRGVWMGMRSGTTNGANWKVWQVHGGDVPIIAGHIQPLIVNAGNTDTIATNGTLSNSDVRDYGFWTGGIGALTQQTCIGPLWAMDTLVMAGGYAAAPIGIPEIVKVAATAKERLSSVLQGSSQMLCLQAIQFGDGGSNPVYLNLDSTAIEFPARKNVSKKIVNYNGIDDSVGFTYYAVSGDTIIHKDSVISSLNKYHWHIHASATNAASWNFSGLSIIGAGDVQLRAVTTFSGMSFTTCPTIVQNSAVISGCAFKYSTISTCNAPNNISTCRFTSVGTGHAIVITTAGTYTFTGNTFTGYAATNGSTGNEAIYNNSGGAVTLNVTGGVASPTIRNGAGASTTVNNNVTITLTGLKNPSEVRVFNAGTTTERAGTGAENITTGTHAFSLPASTSVDVAILSLGYQNTRILAYSTASDATLPVSQVLDRQYLNP